MSKPQITRLEIVGAIIWPSFLAAAAATMVFFAMFDPARLAEIVTLPTKLSRPQGYTIGFFLFWLLTALSSYLTALLLTQTSSATRNEHE
jgi:cytosine/uracil/thiamine/allantoin permease